MCCYSKFPALPQFRGKTWVFLGSADPNSGSIERTIPCWIAQSVEVRIVLLGADSQECKEAGSYFAAEALKSPKSPRRKKSSECGDAADKTKETGVEKVKEAGENKEKKDKKKGTAKETDKNSQNVETSTGVKVHEKKEEHQEKGEDEEGLCVSPRTGRFPAIPERNQISLG